MSAISEGRARGWERHRTATRRAARKTGEPWKGGVIYSPLLAQSANGKKTP